MAEIYLDYSKLINSEQLSKELNGVFVTLVDDKLRFVGNITEAEAKNALELHKPLMEQSAASVTSGE
jgi:hypothetical protein